MTASYVQGFIIVELHGSYVQGMGENAVSRIDREQVYTLYTIHMCIMNEKEAGEANDTRTAW